MGLDEGAKSLLELLVEECAEESDVCGCGCVLREEEIREGGERIGNRGSVRKWV